MQKWRADENRIPHSRLVALINEALREAGMFEAIDELFTEVHKRVDRIIIITNAGSRTVDNFYLTHTLPQLRTLLDKHAVKLTSTEEWVIALGPPPSSEDEEAFREFYTSVKVCKFQHLSSDNILSQYREFRRVLSDELDHCGGAGNGEANIEITSVGDQMCEISAACRLGDCFPQQISLVKLILILDPTNSRFSFQHPDQFVEVSCQRTPI